MPFDTQYHVRKAGSGVRWRFIVYFKEDCPTRYRSFFDKPADEVNRPKRIDSRESDKGSHMLPSGLLEGREMCIARPRKARQRSPTPHVVDLKRVSSPISDRFLPRNEIGENNSI